MEYPKVDYPTILQGFIHGDSIRLESLDGTEIFLSKFELPLGGWLVRDGGFYLTNFLPIQYKGNIFGVTHLQKQSQRGYLKTYPDCYHRWWWFRKQQKDAKGNWLPGTERGLYFRKPFSWRWDIAGTVIDGILRHWIRTKGYLGGHWD